MPSGAPTRPRRPPRAAARLALLSAGAALLTLYSVELYLHHAQHDRAGAVARAAARAGLAYDPRTVREVVADLRADGADVQPFFRMIHTAKDLMPLGNSPRKQIVFCNEIGRYFVFRTDRHGFNNPDRLWDEPVFELALLGDSFVQGACMPDDQGFADLVRRSIPSTLNLGSGGNDPQLDLATLVEYVAPLPVRDVVWFHYAGNDLSGMMEFRRHPILRRYVEEDFSQGLLGRADEVGRTMEDFFARNEESILARADPGGFWEDLEWGRLLRLALLRSRLGLRIDRRPPVDFERFSRIVAKAASIVAQKGGKLAFVIIPTRSGLERPHGDQELDDTVEVLRRHGVPTFDLTPLFARLEPEGSLYALGEEGGHLSRRGHRVVADFVLERVLPALRDDGDDAPG